MYTKQAIILIPTILVANTLAGIVQIDGAGSYQLQSHAINGILDGAAPFLSTDDLATIHQELNGWGVETNGKITLLPINTPAGLALFTLMDQETGGGDSGIDASVGIVSTASNSLSMYINDATQDAWNLIQPPFGSQSLGATFVWGSIGSGDGFAWAGMEYGDALSYNFSSIEGDGGLDAEAFQFVSWDEGWKILGSDGFKTDGSQVFTGSVVPAPPAALLLTVFALNRRRRRNN
ncbi:MAG: hypothetical protein H8E91_06665 [Planctomycetes bacterium]|nr:hypothetical protein [Planctomycetota bacterium]